MKAYAGIKDIPGNIDYVISAIPAGAVLNLLEDCSTKGVKVVHLFTAQFGETGRPEEAELEQAVLNKAREKGIRLLGPNCMGVYNPKQGIAFGDGFPKESGSVGLAFQSSYAAHDFVLLASPRGVRFSKVIGYGNALDFNESDFLDYFTQDPETKIILMYVEGPRDGKRFFQSLRRAAAVKPVIIIKGGRGSAGARAAASHTGSLAGPLKTWEAMVTQAGAIPAMDFDELIDLAVTFQFLPAIKGNRVGVAGGAGGPSVLAADQCEEAGLDVVPLPDEIREEMKSNGIPIWDWISNPADMSIAVGGAFTAGDMFQMMAVNDNFDLLIALVGEPHIHGVQRRMETEVFLKRFNLQVSKLKPLLVAMPDKSASVSAFSDANFELLCNVRTELINAGIPCYPSIGRAARSVRKLIDYYRD